YMGVSSLQQVQAGLVDGGLPASTPVAMIENASLPQQRECRSNLGAMCEDATGFRLKSPAILVIGEVAAQAVTQLLSRSA
ncbi:MAG TPA: uroporphyrinogen-III C-methyltransferase, partial [Pseudomonas sp.]|nr:uroporphyrinogen-III C-methyltransferase [Pseudomonas sp.]